MKAELLEWKFETDTDCAIWWGRTKAHRDGSRRDEWIIRLKESGMFLLDNDDLAGWIEDGYAFNTLADAKIACEAGEVIRQRADSLAHLKAEYPGVTLARHIQLGRITGS